MKTLWTSAAFAVCFLAINNSILGQFGETTIRFQPVQEQELESFCFEIQVKQEGTENMRLGTQNYRIFYDASQIRFLRQTAASLLDNGAHGEARIVQAVHNSDASGYGNLEFSNTLGFINLNINDTGNPSTLPGIPTNSWLSTASMCFEQLTPEPVVELVWGRKGLTDGYATAFTRISVIENELKATTTKLNYLDFSTSSTGLRDRMAVSDIKN